MRWQWRREARVVEPRRAVNAKALELETAKEILAEVFKVRISDVDEMIQNRFEAAGNDDMVSKENGLWPQEFWLVE
jgi:hypothetical protein